jgi:hypothetical protein
MKPQGNSLSSLVRRLEAFEERCGLTVDCVSALATRHETIQVTGELKVVDGCDLRARVFLKVAFYDREGRVIAFQKQSYSPGSFYAFTTFQVTMENRGFELSKIVVFPELF